MIHPFTPSRSTYCRLFPRFDQPNAANLDKLALSMMPPVEGTTIPIDCRKDQMMGAAYTYFGQFIDHDLTEDRTTLRNAGKREPDYTLNYRRHFLDLDNLYGEGPQAPGSMSLYADDGYSFALGDVLTDGQSFDVSLVHGRPQLADPRNGENVLVRQVHVMFLKLHNLIASQLPDSLTPQERFERAKQETQWQYQWLVRHDFLPNVCNGDVYTDVVTNGNYRINWKGRFAIPVEFSQAAFRFGHSMVRPEYSLKGGQFSLTTLFSESKQGPINPEMAIPWRNFFTGVERAMRIDTAIARPLFGLPRTNIRLFTNFLLIAGPHQLPVRTLRRGAATGLPSGQVVRQQLCPEADIPKTSSECPPSYMPWKDAEGLGFREHTPLWYYVLLEAEIAENGLRLGAVGSRLVCEVIEGALRADPNSFVAVDPNWHPVSWKTAEGTTMEIRDLFDLAIFVGLARRLR
jgi:Animal haem peroxidase